MLLPCARICILALLVGLVPSAPAHAPPGPVTACQPWPGESIHDFVLPAVQVGDTEGNIEALSTKSHAIVGRDGAVGDCGEGRGDGELDHAVGGAVLAVDTGEFPYGAWECHGMTGHHSGHVFAQTYPSGEGPGFRVAADWGRNGEFCGDALIEPCLTWWYNAPFPMSVVYDTINVLVDMLLGPACNPLDCVDSTGAAVGPSELTATCAPGADGSYHVIIDPLRTEAPTAGHIWTI